MVDAVLAVDGGGTRCRLALERGAGRIAVTLGPANVFSDFDAALAVLNDGLARLSTQAGLPLAALSDMPAYLGLAGVIDARIADRVRGALPLRRAVVEDDRRSTVRGALGAADGALAALGTGSFLARQADGRIRLCGGWGARLGDEASGYWIARRALSRTLDAVDGLAEQTDLAGGLLARCGGATGIVAFAARSPTAEMAALAPLVIEAAGQGDALACSVLEEGAAHVARTLRALGWRDGEMLCLTGGVAPAYPPFLPAEMTAALTPPKGSALDGALALARDLAGEG
ncbi:BadF/BadG/BcrA/BcrD ATPase family protein [Thetidibacter halocola]|uniref:ATPase n=1 Tax=Thetidibacter halocola TaxID=2827239 RepID=A0A8J8B9Q1_9RHOB|nr:BadF/BadG/BcrA/BcrD ATPase family protein [Thetidibacter halocola]MBS0126752.1 ATPase [Thetidibacter halocola]